MEADTGAHGWLSVLVVVATLALILIRPRGIAEAWVAAAGALAMLLTGAVRLADLWAVLEETASVLLFLLGMMVLTALVERTGLFERLAEACAWLARGSGRLLFCYVFVLGALVTALLSLDVTVIVLTPIVYALATRRRLDALPFMFACAFVANTASLALPISNLTNLLVYTQLRIGFFAFAGRMWLPSVVAVGVNLVIFLWLFRDRLPPRFEPVAGDELPPADWWFWTAAATMSATLVGLLVAGLAARSLAWPALIGAAVLLGVALIGRRVEVAEIAADVSWPLFVFVIGMFLVVRGFERTALTGLAVRLPDDPLRAMLVGVIGGALGSNIVNNVPMAVVALPSWRGRRVRCVRRWRMARWSGSTSDQR